ncbi:hypothetical protein EJB05_00842, partial [Eragrostis curvula]
MACQTVDCGSIGQPWVTNENHACLTSSRVGGSSNLMGSLKAREGSSSYAKILGLGSAVPEHVWPQKSFTDYYFDVAESNHMIAFDLIILEKVSSSW